MVIRSWKSCQVIFYFYFILIGLQEYSGQGNWTWNQLFWHGRGIIINSDCDLAPCISVSVKGAKILKKSIEFSCSQFQGYLNSEEVMGKVLAGRRKNVILASKMGTRVPKYTAEDVEISLTKSLERLQTDYLDLYQAWNCSYS